MALLLQQCLLLLVLLALTPEAAPAAVVAAALRVAAVCLDPLTVASDHPEDAPPVGPMASEEAAGVAL